MPSGIWPDVGVAETVAASGLPTALTVTATLDVVVFTGEDASVTVSVAVKLPAAVYVWVGLWVVLAEEPSPKLQLNEYGALPPVTEPVKDTFSGALPVSGVAEARAESGVVPWIHRSSSGSPRPAWSLVVIGNVDRPIASLGSMTPGWLFSITRSIAASTLFVVYATWLTKPVFMNVGEATTTIGTRNVLLTWSGPLLPFCVSSSVTTIIVLSLKAALPMMKSTTCFVTASFFGMSWNVPGWSLNSST